jgi:hypothetical protein
MSQHRIGDASLVIDGERRILRLTLGALAALEETLGQGDFASLGKRLESPRIADLLVILQALLQGGGHLVSLEALKKSDLDLADAARAIAKAFAALADDGPHPEEPREAKRLEGCAADRHPSGRRFAPPQDEEGAE